MTIIDDAVACDVASHNHAFHLTASRQMNAIVIRKFDRRSLPIIICLLAFVSSAATPGFDTLVNYNTAWTLVYDGGKDADGYVINDI